VDPITSSLTSRKRFLFSLTLFTVALVLPTVVFAWIGSNRKPDSAPLSKPAKKVVLFGMPTLGLSDLEKGDTPNLDRLVKAGSVGAMSVRTYAREPNSAQGYTTLGAGARVKSSLAAGIAFDRNVLLTAGRAAEVAEQLTGRESQGEVLVTGGPETINDSSGLHLPSQAGALGSELKRYGVKTAVVGNADSPSTLLSDQGWLLSRPTGIALMDGASVAVDYGEVERSQLLKQDSSVAGGYRADPKAFVALAKESVDKADVVLLDPGDLDRASRLGTTALSEAEDNQSRQALRRTDEILGSVYQNLPKDTLLLVVSIAAPRTGYLTPVVAVGPGVASGYIDSVSTKKKGVVTVTDIAPTVLRALGKQVPGSMVGNEFRYLPDSTRLDYLQNLDRDTELQQSLYSLSALIFILVQLAVYLFVALLLKKKSRYKSSTSALGVAEQLLLAVAAFPLAVFLLRAVPGYSSLYLLLVPVLLLIVALLVELSRFIGKRSRLQPLFWIAVATVGVLMLDVAAGGYLHTSSIFGYSLQGGGRFYGAPNTTFAIVAAAALIASCIYVASCRDRHRATAFVAIFLGVVLLVDGAPQLGSDVGGILALAPVFGITLLALYGRRITLRSVLAFSLAGTVIVALAAAVDLLRPVESQTHLGQFARELGSDGVGTLVTTVARKEAANWRFLQGSLWTWLIPIVTGFLLYLLAYLRGWAKLLPAGSPQRVGFYSVVGAAIVGFFVNDSGPIVISLMLVFLGPYVALQALKLGTEQMSERES